MRIKPAFTALFATLLIQGCDAPTATKDPVQKIPSLVLLVTPKIIPDFDNPGPAIQAFLDHYSPLISRSEETIIIFGVGNSDHILNYRGSGFWSDQLEWSRLTNGLPVSSRTLNYDQINLIARSFKTRAAASGINLKIYDFIDSGGEFTPVNIFKNNRHNECMSDGFIDGASYNIASPMIADTLTYASAPNGVVAGTLCGHFLADQASHYVHDLGFDGILYKNQLGTRGRWLPDNGPGYSDAEAAAIEEFLQYSKTVLAKKGLMWFDSYNNTTIERDTFSFPASAYRHFDYIIASGFCVVTSTERYLDNLQSKLSIPNGPPILATLDYVDPWYTYDSFTDFPEESSRLEQIAIQHKTNIAGLFFFAHDELGIPVPRSIINSFVARFFGA